MVSEGRAGSRLGPGREFDRIRAILADLPAGPGAPSVAPGSAADSVRSAWPVQVGPGDDAAVLGEGLVLTTDLSLEGVHFRLDWIDAEEAGYRAAAAGMSDLAAMAAAPIGLLVSVAAPGDGALAVQAMAGVKRLVARVGARLLGGDLTRSPGPVVVDVVSVGFAEAPLLRSGARPGDELWVTGALGGAAAAVSAWRRGVEPSPEARRAFVEPTPRIEEARWLVRHGTRAGLDLSDGIAGDAGHLAAASGVATILTGAHLPLHPALAVGTPGPLELALHGGEDYELLVAAPVGELGPRSDEFRDRFGVALTRVGRVEEGSGVWLESVPRSGGTVERRALEPGYDHFSGGERVGGVGGS